MIKLRWFIPITSVVLLITILLIGGMYLSDPLKTVDILGILLSTLLSIFLGFFTALILQERTSKEEDRKKRCNEIFVPLYEGTDNIIQQLRYLSPGKIENSSFKQVRWKRLYIASSPEFRGKIEKFIELTDEYNSWMGNAVNWVRSIIDEKIREAYGNNSMDNSERIEYDSIYVIEKILSRYTNNFVYIALKYNEMSEIEQRDKTILIPELHTYLWGRLRMVKPEMKNEEKAELAHSLTLQINNEIFKELFQSEALAEFREKKNKLYEYAKETRDHLYRKIQEFPVD